MPKLSIYLPDTTFDKLGAPGADDKLPNVSGRIAEIIDRYDEIVESEKPALTRGEWCGIFDALNGTAFRIPGGADMTRYLWAEMDDADPELPTKWGYDKATLVTKLRTMSYVQLVAIMEYAARFWDGDSSLPLDAKLEQVFKRRTAVRQAA